MKKAFISIYTLIVLLILSLTITYIYTQQKSAASYSKGLYEKKQAQYLAESIMNNFMEENSEQVAKIILTDYDKKSNKKFKDKKYIYNGQTYWIKMSRLHSDIRKELDGLYLIFLDEVNVGESKAICEIYVKVFDKKDKDDQNFDKNRLRIEIRHAY